MKKFLKKYLISGILVLVPVIVTVWVLKTLIVWLDGMIFSFIPFDFRPKQLIGFDIPGFGLVLTIIIILVTGIFTRLYIGKKFISLGDAIFARLPFGRAIYQATKQVLHSAIGEGDQKTRRVVLVEYPKAESYAIGFLTGTWGDKDSAPSKGKEDVIVFVPTAPNPTSGFLLIVPLDSVIQTDMSTEDASKLLISGGLLAKKLESV
jgi:uncharacterized membrane protein